jgi:predicted RNA-binding protein with PIN domain
VTEPLELPDLLVVDAANVVGSRPDGWWRDRAAAAARLVSDLERLDATGEVTVVLEGAARAGVEAAETDNLTVVHARGSGDDEIVRQVGAALEQDPESSVTVVTADRELRRRVQELGARTHGPGWLWRRLQ